MLKSVHSFTTSIRVFANRSTIGKVKSMPTGCVATTTCRLDLYVHHSRSPNISCLPVTLLHSQKARPSQLAVSRTVQTPECVRTQSGALTCFLFKLHNTLTSGVTVKDHDQGQDFKHKLWQGFAASWLKPALASQCFWSAPNRLWFDSTLKAVIVQFENPHTSTAKLIAICVSHHLVLSNT